MFCNNFFGMLNMIFTPFSFGCFNDSYWNYFPMPNPSLYMGNLQTYVPSIWNFNSSESLNNIDTNQNCYPDLKFDFSCLNQQSSNNNSENTQNNCSNCSVKTEENKNQTASNPVKNNDNRQNSSDKVRSNDKIDTQKRTDLNDQTICNQVRNGNYKAEYININGHIHYKYPEMTSNLVEINKRGMQMGGYLNKNAAAAFKEMQADAKKEGITLTPQSGYRPNSRQKVLFENKGTTPSALINHASSSAPPGYSEHSTGLALDINGANGGFIKAGSKEYEWLKKNSYKYGFEQSFPAGNAQGLDEEPWHYRFVGKNHENDYIFRHAIANDPQMLAKRK